MDRLLLVISTFCFLFGFAYTLRALGNRVYRHSPLNFFAILTGFALQTAFLEMRGQRLGRCPLTNLFEVLIFLSWSMVLFYLLIGPAYRLSLLGAFTSPLVFVFQVTALLIPGIDAASARKGTINAWLELHAALSVVAYGAFALACVAGVMYLAQERQLKSHNIRSIFYHLPPIRDLAVANRRLVLTGFLLLTGGLVAGFAMGNAHEHLLKISWSAIVWLMYGLILMAVFVRHVASRRVAWLSVWAFTLVLGTLWSLKFIPQSPSL